MEENTPLDPLDAGRPQENHPNTNHSGSQTPGDPPIVNDSRDPIYWELESKVEDIRREIQKVIVGQDELIESMAIAMLVKGHILIEGVPGIAKTLTAKLFSRCIKSEYKRIQFTPDLMPTDVLGTNVFNVKKTEFEFKPGPLFTNVVLIDEINRAPAKTQSALFEVMQETQITVDGHTYVLDQPFMVLATQNPIEQEGTYKLPEAQLDRFLFKIELGYPNADEELTILKRFKEDFDQKVTNNVNPVLDAKEIGRFATAIERVTIGDDLLEYITRLISDTRDNGDLFLGASPRASLALLKSAKAKAALSGRDFVIPEDVRAVLHPVLNHRIILSPEREMEGMTTRDMVETIIKKTEVPR